MRLSKRLISIKGTPSRTYLNKFILVPSKRTTDLLNLSQNVIRKATKKLGRENYLQILFEGERNCTAL